MDLKERSANPNRHPWELSRADMALRLLADKPRDTRYVDVGSGDLYFSRRLSETTDVPVFAVDVHYADQEPEPGLVICTDLAQVPEESIDCAVLMDVLEHVDDDVGLLRAVNRKLVPDSELLITVPAHASLWSDHDVFLGHRRRYQRDQLLGVLQRAELTAVECFYFYCIPYVARAVAVGLSRFSAHRRPRSAVGHWPYASDNPFTKAVRTTLNCDFRLSRLMGSTPLSGCGLSICVTCRRRSV